MSWVTWKKAQQLGCEGDESQKQTTSTLHPLPWHTWGEEGAVLGHLDNILGVKSPEERSKKSPLQKEPLINFMSETVFSIEPFVALCVCEEMGNGRQFSVSS